MGKLSEHKADWKSLLQYALQEYGSIIFIGVFFIFVQQ